MDASHPRSGCSPTVLEREHLTTRPPARCQVLRPLLLASVATARLPALPTLPCSAANRWLRAQSAAGTSGDGGHFDWRRGQCRTSACSHTVLSTGATSPAELAAAEALGASLSYTLPFSNTSAARVARAPLRCTLFGGRFKGHPLDNKFCKSGKHGHVLHPPVWEQYRTLLGAAAKPPLAPTLRLLPKRSAASAVVDVEYDRLAAELRRHNRSTVVYLPGRLRVVGVPEGVQQRFELFCMCRPRPGDEELFRCGQKRKSRQSLGGREGAAGAR